MSSCKLTVVRGEQTGGFGGALDAPLGFSLLNFFNFKQRNLVPKNTTISCLIRNIKNHYDFYELYWSIFIYFEHDVKTLKKMEDLSLIYKSCFLF